MNSIAINPVCPKKLREEGNDFYHEKNSFSKQNFQEIRSITLREILFFGNGFLEIEKAVISEEWDSFHNSIDIQYKRL